MHHVRSKLALVITVGSIADCGATRTAVEAPPRPAGPTPSPPMPSPPMRVSERPRFCLYTPFFIPSHTGPFRAGCCNPPRPIRVDCPDAGTVPPPGRSGWVRALPQVTREDEEGRCTFTSERWCPPASRAARCDEPIRVLVRCVREGDDLLFPAFTYEASRGRCVSIAGFRCTAASGCNIGRPEPVACASGRGPSGRSGR